MWHYECNGQPVGPVSEEALKLLIRDGVLSRSTLVWKSGLSAWVNADETDLMRYFDTPPPLAPKSESLRRATEPSPEDPASRTGPGRTQSELASRYAETKGDASEPAIFSAPTSDPGKRPYEVFAGVTQPLGGIASHAQVAVIAFVLVTAVTILSDLATFGFIDQALSGTYLSEAESESQGAAVDSFTQIAAVAYFIAFVWSAIVIGRWTYRAMKNLRDMGLETTVSPGGTIGWHIVPIALLWMPFRGMAQIWRGSIHGAPTGDSSLPASMRLWWAAWLFGNWSSFGAFRALETGLASQNFELVQVALISGIVGSSLLISAALLLLGLIKRVTRAQDDHSALQFN